MATGHSAKTEVGSDGVVTLPSPLRDRLGIEPGDVLRWSADESGTVSLEVVQQREGVFDDFEPVDAGETDAVEVEREFGSE